MGASPFEGFAALRQLSVTGIQIQSSGRKRESMSNDIKAQSKLNNSELWGGLIGLALGVFVIWSGIKLKIGSINDPGSGFVLFYTGLLICVFAAPIVIAAVTEG